MISVLIPSYNERDRLPATLREVELFHRSYEGLISEVIIIDDGSRDETVERASYFMTRLPMRIERLSKNRGKWAAIRHGIGVAKEDAILILDADGAASIWELEWMAKCTKKDVDWFIENKVALFGSRFMDGSLVIGKSFARSLVSRVYGVYSRFWYWFATSHKDISDMQCPFKLIYRSKLRLEDMIVERWSGDIELAYCYHGKIQSFPVSSFTHKRGSKIPFTAIFTMAYETLVVARRCRKLNK